MHKNRRVRILVSWMMAGALAVGVLSGCTQKRDTSEESSGEVSQEPVSGLQGHNEDADSNLGAWGRAMGSVLIMMNEGSPYYFGGYEATEANRKAASNILKQSWDISSRRELLKQIKQLLKSESRQEYLKEAKEMNALSEKQLKKAMNQLSGSLLVHYKMVQRNWEHWGKRGLVAWDMCRVSHLAQWGYIAGYLDVREAQAMIEPAAEKLKEQFDSWEDVVMNWLDGYALAAAVDLEQPGNDYEARKEIYTSLVEGQKEKGALYDDSLFRTEIVPLSDTSYAAIMKEVQKKKTEKKKTEKKKTNKKKGKENHGNSGKKQEETDREEEKE